MTRKEYNEMMLRRRMMTLLVAGLLLVGCFNAWLAKRDNKQAASVAIYTKIEAHKTPNNKMIDDASAQCIGR